MKYLLLPLTLSILIVGCGGRDLRVMNDSTFSMTPSPMIPKSRYNFATIGASPSPVERETYVKIKQNTIKQT
ncbi:MAG: hypothetical protein KAG10_08530, partial [Methylococcales bacterium]|nr:hypothetical protein [Methylococcales bacterium]